MHPVPGFSFSTVVLTIYMPNESALDSLMIPALAAGVNHQAEIRFRRVVALLNRNLKPQNGTFISPESPISASLAA